MKYSVAHRVYHRPFGRPLHLHHGLWQTRAGIVVQLTHPNGQIRYGEIAPLEWFGTESLEEAIAFCESISPTCAEEHLWAVPDSLPACQFGIESALESFSCMTSPRSRYTHSILLPTGIAALDGNLSLLPEPSPTYKWKIGVAALVDELETFDRLIQALPRNAILRLDANGGLSADEAARWLEQCERTDRVEFLEQPLPANQVDTMQQLAQQFQTPLALDESVATLEQLQACIERGWPGVFVVKPAIAGSPRRLRHLSQQTSLDLVWSSVFETAIAQRYIFEQLIPSVSTCKARALGFGVNQWFNDQWSRAGTVNSLWQSLSPLAQSSPIA